MRALFRALYQSAYGAVRLISPQLRPRQLPPRLLCCGNSAGRSAPLQPFSCSASGSRSLDFRRVARRRGALHAIACSHLLKTPRYLLGHT